MVISEDIQRKIISIAEEVRDAYCGPIEKRFYKFGEAGPAGACFVSSRDVGTSLKEKLGIEYDIVRGKFLCGKAPPKNPRKNHIWVELPQYDNEILDTTADQFGDFPPVWFPADKKCYRQK